MKKILFCLIFLFSVPHVLSQSCGGTYTHSEMVMQLQSEKIKGDWTSSVGKKKCPNFNSFKCTTMEKMPKKVVLLLAQIRAECPDCEILITGGTEKAGHKTHGPNKAIFDMRFTNSPNLKKYLNKKKRKINGAIFQIHKPQHWHVIATNYGCK